MNIAWGGNQLQRRKGFCAKPQRKISHISLLYFNNFGQEEVTKGN
jgi:hypothetical protein